jgi:hypothetical protein
MFYISSFQKRVFWTLSCLISYYIVGFEITALALVGLTSYRLAFPYD